MKRIIEVKATDFTCNNMPFCKRYVCNVWVMEVLKQTMEKESFEQMYKDCPFKNIKPDSKIRIIVEEIEDEEES